MAEYSNVIRLIGRAHAGLLEMVKLELERLGIFDLNNVQAMMIYNIGEVEMSIGELTLRGCYLGSNVTYNVRKMVQSKYMTYEKSEHDKRSVRVTVSPKGLEVCKKIGVMFDRHRVAMERNGNISTKDMASATLLLTRLERMWGREHDGVPRSSGENPIDSKASPRESSAFRH